MSQRPACWLTAAGCRDATPEEADLAFHPEEHVQRVFIARFCEACPVARECLLDGIRADGAAPQGVRGGLTERQRRRLRDRAPRRGWPTIARSA